MLDTFDIVKYVVAVTENCGVSVQWVDDGAPRTDGRTMYIPRPHSGMTPDEITTFKRAVAHETSHVRYTDFNVLKNTKLNECEHLVMNAIEDCRIDYHNDTLYEGDAVVSAASAQATVDSVVNRPELSDFMRDNITPLLATSLANSEYLPNTGHMVGQLEGVMSEKGKEVFAKLAKYNDAVKDLRKYTDPLEGTYNSMLLAKKIAKEVFGQEGEPPPSKEEAGKTQSKEQQKQQKEQRQAEAAGKSDEEKKEQKDKRDGEGVFHSLIDEIEEQEDNPHRNAYGTPPTGKGVYVPDPQPTVYDRTEDATEIGGYERMITYSLSNKVRTLIQINSRKRRIYGQKTGKLNNGSLHRITADVDGYSERVFKQTIDKKTLDTAITLLVDCSGSMSGSRIDYAAVSAGMLNDVLANKLHVNTEVLGFTEKSQGHTIYVFKKFGGKSCSALQLASRFKNNVSMVSNVDGESIMYAAHRLKQQKQKRKIMIVLSDGMPSGGFSKGDIEEYTTLVIKDIEKSKTMEIYGIGIETDCVKQFYKNYAVVRDIGRLEEVLLNVLKNAVIN